MRIFALPLDRILPVLVAQQKLFRFSSLWLPSLSLVRQISVISYTSLNGRSAIQIANRWNAKIGCALVASEIAHLLPRFRISLSRSGRSHVKGLPAKEIYISNFCYFTGPLNARPRPAEKIQLVVPRRSYPCTARDATGQKAKIRTRACTHARMKQRHAWDTRKKIRPIRARRLGMHAILR